MSKELMVWWDLDRPESPNPVIVRLSGSEWRIPVDLAKRYRDDFTYILNHPSVSVIAPEASALPDGWEWEHYDDGSHAGARGVRVACQGGLVRVVGDYEGVVDAPIAVVLAVIARNAEGGAT